MTCLGCIWLVSPAIAVPFRFHWLPVAEDELSTTELPWQNVVGPPAVIVGVAGVGLTVTVVIAEVALQLLPLVTVTV